MTYPVLYLILSILSILCIVAAIIVGTVIHKKSVKNADTMKKHSALSPFHAFLIGFFISSVLMFYPVFFSGRFEGDVGGIRFVKSLLMSLLCTLQAFFLNGDFSVVADSVNSAISGGQASFYLIYSIILHVVAPILTFGFILSFFRETISMLKYVIHPFTDIYIMSELNESSIELAKDIINNKPGKKQVVFTDVFEKDDEAIFELISEAKRLGAICLKKDITELGLKRANINRKLFFISTDEDENLRQALTLIKRCNGNPRYDNDKTQLYVFASSVESETLLDAAEHGKMKVRRINERHNLILDTLIKNSVFDGAISDDKDVKHINAAIIGLGTYGTELLKALCWLCQMPGYELTVHVFEKGKGKEKIESIAPELVALNDDSEDGSKKIEGDAHYRIVFHDETDVKSKAFTDYIQTLKDLTVAYVTLGTDEQNIETAMRLRMALARRGTTKEADKATPFPPIYAVVYSALKNEIVQPAGLRGIPDIVSYNNNYGITFIGNISTRFSLDVIEQDALEKKGMECHLAWSNSDLDKMRLEKKKCEEDPEYVERCRNAVEAAQAECDKAKLALEQATNEQRAELEEQAAKAEKRLKNAIDHLEIVSDPDAAITKAEAAVAENERKYEKYEYFRKSSISQSVHKTFMLKHAEDMFDENGNPSPEAEVFEHCRWNAYMRSIGYCKPNGGTKRKNHIAKYHHDLIPHPLLSETEKHKDVAVKTVKKTEDKK